MTGLCGSLCEPYWLVTVSGFQGSSCSGFPAYPAVLPAACRPTCVRRQGDTIRTRPEAVNGFSEHFSAATPILGQRANQRNKDASRDPPEGIEAARCRNCAASVSLWIRLPTSAGFQHTLQCLNDSLRCGAVLYQRPHTGARGSAPLYVLLARDTMWRPQYYAVSHFRSRPHNRYSAAIGRANRRLPTCSTCPSTLSRA
jgi:hypothetical protein